MLEALAHAHSKGVVHRDVKPANVMLEDGDEVSVRLLDFGLAQLEHADTLTAVGDVPGTLAYIAPERLAGEEATGAADVWAVGVLLWEALAGRHPFWAVSPLETARRVEQGAQPLAELRPDLRASSAAPWTACSRSTPASARPRSRRSTSCGRWSRAAWSAAELRPRPPSCASAPRTLRSRRSSPAGPAFLLPFFPTGWPFLLGAVVALVAFLSPAAGLAAALAVPVLPLGNVSLGLAVAYVPLALAWLLLFAADARSSLLFLSGPLLAFVHLLPLVPVIALEARGIVRRRPSQLPRSWPRLATVVVVELRLPLTGETAPRPRGVRGAEQPGAALDGSLAALTSRPTIVAAIVIVALAAASASLARSRGLWGVAAWGAAFLGACSSSRSPWAELPSPPSGRPRRSGSRPRRSRIRWFGRLDRVVRGHNGARI